jgi:hypothetical protein
MNGATDPESMIMGPESDFICTSQNIAFEIHNVPQPPTTWIGISINRHASSQWAFILDQTSTSCNLLRWDLIAQTQTIVFTGLEDMYCFNRRFECRNTGMGERIESLYNEHRSEVRSQHELLQI